MPRWTVQLEGGPRRVNHAAISAGHKIFSFGGYCTGEDYEHTKPIDVHVLNTVSLRWRLLPAVGQEEEANVPYQRYGHTAVNYNDCAYIWGGRNDTDGACGILFCFDTESYTWSRPPINGEPPPARDGHSACVLDQKMFIFGGYEEVSDLFSDRIFTLDFTNFCWEYVKTKGTPAKWRDFHTATAIGSKMYVFGGRSDEGGEMFTNREIYCNKMHVYDTDTNSWSTLPSPPGVKPTGRRSHSTFEYNGCLYVFGGYNGLLDHHFHDLYTYDPVESGYNESQGF
ncbi:kelch domain-containing protein 3-like [Littorina saxatilis]|uniref:kelch domain-containing protein 3-like n=1 Tax=Littorina saxatilis TaxID=31220 RepID=UPI0038B4A5F8